MRDEIKTDYQNDVVKEEKLAFEKIVVVGYALTSKKINSFLQPKLLSLARYLTYIHTLHTHNVKHELID